MTLFVTIKLRLKDKHAAELNRQARAVNFVWNYCNETQHRAASRGSPPLSEFLLQKLTAGASTLLDIHSHTIKEVCKWHSISRASSKRSALRFRKNGKSLGWVPFKQGHVRIVEQRRLRFRGVEYESMHWREHLTSGFTVIHAGSFNQDSQGRWYINCFVEVPPCAPMMPVAVVGVDLGFKSLASLSNGDVYAMPALYRNSEKIIGAKQRANKSRQYKRMHARVQNRRRDYLHKLSAHIVSRFSHVVVGNAPPSRFARSHWAKSVHDAGWASFKRMLSYKALMRNGRMIEVDEHLTSQTCSSCGALPPERPRGIAGLGIREWTCGGCGATHDRDVNAARNILARGLASLAEGAAKGAEQPISGYLVKDGIAAQAAKQEGAHEKDIDAASSGRGHRTS